MRLVVIGDTHGYIEAVRAEIERLQPVDLLVFTGDLYKDAAHLGRKLKVPVQAVVGNCDEGVKGPKEAVFEAGGKTILVTHGHLYSVKKTMINLFYRGQEVKADLVFYGHTHVGSISRGSDGMWLINPGSPTYPRAGSAASFAVVEIEGAKVEARLIEFS